MSISHSSLNCYLFILALTHGFLFYPMSCNTLINLVLKLFQIWPVGAPFKLVSAPFGDAPPFFGHLPAFWHEIFQAYLVLCPGIRHFAKEL